MITRPVSCSIRFRSIAAIKAERRKVAAKMATPTPTTQKSAALSNRPEATAMKKQPPRTSETIKLTTANHVGIPNWLPSWPNSRRPKRLDRGGSGFLNRWLPRSAVGSGSLGHPMTQRSLRPWGVLISQG